MSLCVWQPASKQQTLAPPTSTKIPKKAKLAVGVPRLGSSLDRSRDPKQPYLSSRIPVSHPRWASARPNGPGPERNQSGAKTAHDHQNPGMGGSETGASRVHSIFIGRIHQYLVQYFGCLFVVFGRFFLPRNGGNLLANLGPFWARIASRCRRPKLGRIWAARAALPPPCQPPLLVVCTSQNGPNTPLDAVFACRVPVLLRFGVFWPALVR